MGFHYQKLNDFRFIWGKWRGLFRLTLSFVLWLCRLARTYSWVPGQELAGSKVKCLVQVTFPSWATTSNDLSMQEGNLDIFLLQFKALRAIPSWAVCGTDSKASHFSSRHPAVLTSSQALYKEHSLETTSMQISSSECVPKDLDLRLKINLNLSQMSDENKKFLESSG